MLCTTSSSNGSNLKYIHLRIEKDGPNKDVRCSCASSFSMTESV